MSVPMWILKDEGCDPDANQGHRAWVEYVKNMNFPRLSKAPCEVTPIFDEVASEQETPLPMRFTSPAYEENFRRLIERRENISKVGDL